MEDKLEFVPYTEEGRDQQRIEELKDNIELYTLEITRWKKELAVLKGWESEND